MTWDNALPKLPMQRQLLHIAIFDSVCWNFRPLLFLKFNQIRSLAPYKQVLLQSQKCRIGMAALKELEAVATLHSMFGGSYTRFAAIIFNTFEAATLLLCLCTHADFPFNQGDDNTEVLGIKANRLSTAFKCWLSSAAWLRQEPVWQLSSLPTLFRSSRSNRQAQLLPQALVLILRGHPRIQPP